MNGTGNKPITWFTLPQIIFLIISAVFVCYNNDGLSKDVIDYILSALSIMSALFMSLIVIVLDKLKIMEFNDGQGNSDVNHLHAWNYIKQFASLTSYATLISLLLIAILIGTLLFGKSTDIHEYGFVTLAELDSDSILLFVKLSLVVVVRFVFCYFLLDFLLMTLYAISLIYQSIFTDLEIVKPTIKVNREEPIQDTISHEFGKYNYIKWLTVVFIMILLCIAYIVLG